MEKPLSIRMPQLSLPKTSLENPNYNTTLPIWDRPEELEKLCRFTLVKHGCQEDILDDYTQDAVLNALVKRNNFDPTKGTKDTTFVCNTTYLWYISKYRNEQRRREREASILPGKWYDNQRIGIGKSLRPDQLISDYI